MAYSGTLMLQDNEIFQVFAKCRELGAIAMVHAENGSVINELEKEMSKMGITGPEGHFLSRPEKVKDYNANQYYIDNKHLVYFSLKLKQQIELLPLLNKLGKISLELTYVRFIIVLTDVHCMLYML